MLQKTYDAYKGRLAVLIIAGMFLLLSLAVVVHLSLISNNEFEDIIFIFLTVDVPVILILSFFFICLNRCCCRVYFDFQGQKLIRKGYIRGYMSELSFCDIEKVVLVRDLYGNKEYIYILDKTKKIFSDLYKKSFFRMENNLDNRKLLSQVWNNNIEILPPMFISF